jgi:hypothetical protein
VAPGCTSSSPLLAPGGTLAHGGPASHGDQSGAACSALFLASSSTAPNARNVAFCA